MAEGLYPNQWYNGQYYDTTQQGYILDVYRLVGGVRLRQSRMSNTSCVERRFLDKTALHGSTLLDGRACRCQSCVVTHLCVSALCCDRPVLHQTCLVLYQACVCARPVL